MKSKWRAWALAAIFLIFAVAGLILHLASKGFGEDNSANSGPPFLLGIYTQSPSQPIRINLELYNNGSSKVVDVYLNAPPSDNILILSTQQDVALEGENSPSFRRLPNRDSSENHYDYFYQITGIPSLSEDPRGPVIARFRVPDSTLVMKAQEVIARLPLVGRDEDSTQYTPEAAMLGFDPGIYLNPTLRPGYKVTDRTPSHYIIPTQPDSVQDLYWNPKNLITEEQVQGVGEQISGWNISTSPSDGISDQGNFVWQGDYGLAGVLTAINPGAADTRASGEFFSGIALATAAAALIALIQEARDKFSFKKTASTSSSEESAPEESAPEESAPEESAPEESAEEHATGIKQSMNRPVKSGLGWPELHENRSRSGPSFR